MLTASQAQAHDKPCCPITTETGDAGNMYAMYCNTFGGFILVGTQP